MTEQEFFARISELTKHEGPELARALQWLEGLQSEDSKAIMAVIDGMIVMCQHCLDYAYDLRNQINTININSEDIH